MRVNKFNDINRIKDVNRYFLSDKVNALPDKLKKMVNRYYEAVDLLIKEMCEFNSKFDEDILEFKDGMNCVSKDYFALSSKFVNNSFGKTFSFVISSKPHEPLYFDYSDNFISSNEEILAAFHLFLSVVESIYKLKMNKGVDHENE